MHIIKDILWVKMFCALFKWSYKEFCFFNKEKG